MTRRALVLAILLSCPALAGERNLQVLPRDISAAELRSVMEKLDRALGVKCDFCHVPDDPASDANPRKVVSRARLREQKAWNEKHAATGKRLTCYKCHLGKAVPDYVAQTRGDPAAAVARVKEITGIEDGLFEFMVQAIGAEATSRPPSRKPAAPDAPPKPPPAR
ncbi:MAG: photosynthetic reaction center cytochrome c subunit family protein [Acidobacteriota bacterium]